MRKRLLSYLLFFLPTLLFGQDFFIKSYSYPAINNQNSQIEVMNDGHYIVAGQYKLIGSSSKVFVRKFNPCGIELWSKEISDGNFDMSMTDLNIDSNQNIVFSGVHDTYNQNPKPYIIQFDKNGNLLYSKVIESQLGYNNLNYSSSISPNGDLILLNVYHYTSSPPNNFKLSISRLDDTGVIKWTKNYDNVSAGIWSVMTATRDGGAIINMSNFVCKVNSLGDVDWARNYNGMGSQRKPIETDSGYVFAKYYLGGLDRGNFISIKHNGDVGWYTDSYINFFPYRGTTRRNGNILFSGSNPLNGNSAVFLELDCINGSIVQFKQNQSINGIFASDLGESTIGDILFTGPDNRGIVQQLATGKLNDTLSTISCVNDHLSPQQTSHAVSINNVLPVVAIANNDIIVSPRNFTIANIPISTALTDCSYTKARGDYKLGNDTTLCVGQSIRLGNNNSEFDAYLWSNGSTNKTIVTNLSETYWLQVISACDTLRDTINVTYLPSILFSLGPDTVACGDSIILGQNLSSNINYLWSTGDTTPQITVKASGVYWVEHQNKCNSFRDSIKVDFLPQLAPINLGRDTILCPKQNIILGSLNSPYKQFEWSNGSSNKTIVASTAGDYWLKASDQCNTSIDTIKVSFYPEIGLNLGPDTTICLGDSIILAKNLRFKNYHWSDGSSDSTLTVKQAGVYWLEVQTNCGAVRDSINVSLTSPLNPPTLFADTNLCEGENITLNPGNLVNYLWSTGASDPTITVSDSGLYWVETSNRCDTLRDSIAIGLHPSLNLTYIISSTNSLTGDTIEFVNTTPNSLNPAWSFGNSDSAFVDSTTYSYSIDGNYAGSLTVKTPEGCIQSETFQINILLSKYFAPNIFSPNNDGINDVLKPYGKDIESFETKIYNRWGELIFESNNAAWDGKNSSNVRAQDGTYNYIIKLNLKNGKQEVLKGNVSLIR